MAPIEEKPGGVDTEQGHAVGAQPDMEAFTLRRMVVVADIGDTADTVADVWASSPRRARSG